MHPDFDLSGQIQRFENQYARNPDSLIFARLADLHRKAGSPRRALEVLEEGLERHPDYLSAHIVRARALQAMDRREEAEAAYRRVLELDRQNLVALRALAELARERGDRSEARDWYERLLQVDPRNEQARTRLGKLESSVEPSSAPSAPSATSGPEEASAPESGDPGRRGPAEGSEATSPGATEGGSADDGRRRGTPPETDGPRGASNGTEVPDRGGAEPRRPVEDPAEREELANEVRRIVAEVRERFGRRGADDAEAAAGGGEAEAGRDRPSGAAVEPSSTEEPVTDEGAAGSDAGAAGPDDRSSVDAGTPTRRGEGEAGGEPESEGPPPPERGEEAGDDEDLVTETLAQLYASQGFYEEAIEMYEEMTRERPEDPALRQRLSAVRARARGEEPDEEPPPPRRRERRRDEGARATANGTVTERSPPGERWGTGEVGPGGRPGRDERAHSMSPPEAPVPTARQHLRALLRGEAIPGYANQLLRGARDPGDDEA